MENVWGSTELMRTDALSAEGEYLEAEVVDGCGGDEPKGRHGLRFLRPLTVFFATIFAVSMVGGYVGGGAFYTTIEAVDALVAQLAGEPAKAAKAAPVVEGVPVGSAVVTADGLRIRCAGAFVKLGKGENGEPMVVVALEVQNVGDEKVVLRKGQFEAVSEDGLVVEPLDQTIARGDKGSFYQFTSTALEPGDEYCTVTASFYEVTRPVRLIYRPFTPASRNAPAYATFEIGGMQETMLA